jgi:hypothetical protein
VLKPGQAVAVIVGDGIVVGSGVAVLCGVWVKMGVGDAVTVGAIFEGLGVWVKDGPIVVGIGLGRPVAVGAMGAAELHAAATRPNAIPASAKRFFADKV